MIGAVTAFSLFGIDPAFEPTIAVMHLPAGLDMRSPAGQTAAQHTFDAAARPGVVIVADFANTHDPTLVSADGRTTGPVMSWMLGNGPMEAGYNSLDVDTASTDTTGRHYITGEYDASGNGANGTGTGGVWEVGSHDGGAASFDGSTGVLTASGPVIDTTKSFTMSGWVNLTDEVKHYAVAARNGVNAPSAWLGYDPNINTWAFEMPSNDSTAPTSFPGRDRTGGLPVAGTWTHLAAVYTATGPTSGNLALYVNGVLAGTGSTTTAWNNSSTALTVGARTGSDFLNGSIDDVAVYSHAIGAGEVTSLYTAGKSRIPTGYSVTLGGVTAGSTVSGAVTLSATTSQTGVAKYLSYIVSGPSCTEVFGGAETAATGGTGGQFAGVSLATATLADGSYTITPRATMQNGGTQDFPAVSFTISNNPGHSALIKRSDSPEISVYTGNARVVYTDWNDLVAGYGSSPNIITVTDPPRRRPAHSSRAPEPRTSGCTRGAPTSSSTIGTTWSPVTEPHRRPSSCRRTSGTV